MDPFDEKENKNDEQDDDEYESVIIYTPLGISWARIVGGSCNDMILYGMVFYC